MKKNSEKIIPIIVLISFIIPMFDMIYKVMVAPTINIENIPGLKVKTDYVLILTQCLLGIIAILVPWIISKKIKIKIPYSISYLYIALLYIGIFFGEINEFYYKVPYFDKLLHIFSAIMLVELGIYIFNLLNNEDTKLNPKLIILFAFCFSLTLGLIWEIYEYSFDRIIRIKYAKICIRKWSPINRKNCYC